MNRFPLCQPTFVLRTMGGDRGTLRVSGHWAVTFLMKENSAIVDSEVHEVGTGLSFISGTAPGTHEETALGW